MITIMITIMITLMIKMMNKRVLPLEAIGVNMARMEGVVLVEHDPAQWLGTSSNTSRNHSRHRDLASSLGHSFFNLKLGVGFFNGGGSSKKGLERRSSKTSKGTPRTTLPKRELSFMKTGAQGDTNKLVCMRLRAAYLPPGFVPGSSTAPDLSIP